MLRRQFGPTYAGFRQSQAGEFQPEEEDAASSDSQEGAVEPMSPAELEDHHHRMRRMRTGERYMKGACLPTPKDVLVSSGNEPTHSWRHARIGCGAHLVRSAAQECAYYQNPYTGPSY